VFNMESFGFRHDILKISKEFGDQKALLLFGGDMTVPDYLCIRESSLSGTKH
jgi:hypothetical protein